MKYILKFFGRMSKKVQTVKGQKKFEDEFHKLYEIF
jgi:hypothetical protein